MGLLALNYVGRLNAQVTLGQRLGMESGAANTLYTSTSSLKVKMSDAFSPGLSHAIRFNSDIVGALGKKRDAVTTVNLIYGF